MRRPQTNRRFTDAEIIAIRVADEKLTTLAATYGCGYGIMWKIKHFDAYRDVSQPADQPAFIPKPGRKRGKYPPAWRRSISLGKTGVTHVGTSPNLETRRKISETRLTNNGRDLPERRDLPDPEDLFEMLLNGWSRRKLARRFGWSETSIRTSLARVPAYSTFAAEKQVEHTANATARFRTVGLQLAAQNAALRAKLKPLLTRYVAANLTYEQIRDGLNSLGIRSVRGRVWTRSGVAAMLRKTHQEGSPGRGRLHRLGLREKRTWVVK